MILEVPRTQVYEALCSFGCEKPQLLKLKLRFWGNDRVMKLYYVPGTCSLSPMITLNELKLPYELDRIDLKAGKKTGSGASYLDINPKGYVPTLVLDDGQVLTEGVVIIQYLADLKPEMNLSPRSGTFERVRLHEWLHFIATELHKNLSPLYHPKAPEEFKAAWKETKVIPRLEFFNQHLEARPYVMGDQFTIADGYAFYTLRA